MSQDYFVASIKATDQDKFQKLYGSQDQPLKQYGGKVLPRGPDADRLGGDIRGIVILIGYKSKEETYTVYHSEEYQTAKAVRKECSDINLVIAENVNDYRLTFNISHPRNQTVFIKGLANTFWNPSANDV